MSIWSDAWHSVTDFVDDAVEGIGDFAEDVVWDGIKDAGEFIWEEVDKPLIEGAIDAWKTSVEYAPEILLGAASFIPGAQAFTIPALSYMSNLRGQQFATQKWQAEMQFNAVQAEINRQWQEQMWHMSNEYNSYANQLSRLSAAGLGANSLFGGLGASGSASPMSGSSASYSSGLASSLLTSSAQNQSLLAKAEMDSTQAGLNKYDLHWNTLTEQARFDGILYYNENLQADITNKEVERRLNEAEITVKKEMLAWYCKLSEEKRKEIIANTNLLRNKALTEVATRLNVSMDTANKILMQAVIKRQEQLIAQQVKTEENRTELVGQQYKTEVANTEYVKSQTAHVNELAYGEYLSSVLKEYEVGFSEATGIPFGTDSYNYTLYVSAAGSFEEYFASLAHGFNHNFMNTAGSTLAGSLGNIGRGSYKTHGTPYRSFGPSKSVKNPNYGRFKR